MPIAKRVFAATFRPREPAGGGCDLSQDVFGISPQATGGPREKMRSRILSAADFPR
jgi:hypothetical protein